MAGGPSGRGVRGAVPTALVTRLWEVSKADEMALHCWLPDVNYRTLTTDEINRSALRAAAIGETVKAVQTL